MTDTASMALRIHDFVRRDFHASFGQKGDAFPSHPLWASLADLGTELWLDTGSLEESGALWNRHFSALTTNNTLLNNEVQKGHYDALVGEACALLEPYGLDERELRLEIAFILNAVHGLRLVEEYDVMVSVEEHTDLAHDAAAALRYGLRYHAVCPERFIIKLPLTPSGLLATRQLSAQGVPVNHTLGFSARQNYMIARIGRPAFVNVFMGRLNGFVSSNGLGSGDYIGERATLASQQAIKALRDSGVGSTRQIGASLRSGEQIRDLAGLDVLTMPPKAAAQFLELGLQPGDLADRTGESFELGFDGDAKAVRLDTLWDIDDALVSCLDALDKQDLDECTADALLDFFAAHGCGDLLYRWTDAQIATSAEEGKIPKLSNWKDLLACGEIGLDTVMNLGGLNAFIGDQRDMDERVSGLIGRAPAAG